MQEAFLANGKVMKKCSKVIIARDTRLLAYVSAYESRKTFSFCRELHITSNCKTYLLHYFYFSSTFF